MRSGGVIQSVLYDSQPLPTSPRLYILHLTSYYLLDNFKHEAKQATKYFLTVLQLETHVETFYVCEIFK